MIKHSLAIAIAAVACGVAASSSAAPLLANTNLCYNGSFDNPTNALDGWIIDYQWEGNSHYMQNHTRIKPLSSYQGHKTVMHLDGASGGYTDTKAECRPIPYEKGARYQCTMDVNSDTAPHIYFVGYKWKPGMRPYTDQPPHPGDLRRIYKSQYRNHKETNLGNGWKRLTFEFPIEDASKLAQQSLAELRFFTVISMVVADFKGQLYLDDVKIKRIK